MCGRAHPKPYIFAASPSFQRVNSPASWAVARAFGWPAFGYPARLSANTSSSPARPGPASRIAIRSLLRQIKERGETAVVVDPECEFVSEFYQPGRGDFILNPLDARCPRWSPWNELRDESHAADCDTLAAPLPPHPPDATHDARAA